MHLDLARDTGRELPAIADPTSIRSARIWHCKYRSLAALSSCANLETLEVATYPDFDLLPLVPLGKLRALRVLHLPNVHDLAPLSRLVALESLSLATLPAWDSSGRVQVVESLTPIAELRSLRHLQLFGVVTSNRSLSALHGATSLRSARFSKVPAAEIAAFYARTSASDEFNPEVPFDVG